MIVGLVLVLVPGLVWFWGVPGTGVHAQPPDCLKNQFSYTASTGYLLTVIVLNSWVLTFVLAHRFFSAGAMGFMGADTCTLDLDVFFSAAAVWF